jgi:hypothetical protein
MGPVSLPRSKNRRLELPERGPFSACCGADIKVSGHRRSAGKSSLSSTTSRLRSAVVVLDLVRELLPVVSSVDECQHPTH